MVGGLAMTDEPAALEACEGALAALRSGAAPGGIPKRQLFALAKDSTDLSPSLIERLLDRNDHDARVLAVSIMDFQARSPRLPDQVRRQLFDLYRRRHDRIDTWDLVDRSAPYVVGGYLFDKPRDPLYRLAASDRWYERRTAIVATYYFIRRNDLDDTFAIGDVLAHDPHELVQKAVGGWVREAGKRDRGLLLAFLDRNAPTMPRVALRYALEHLDPVSRQHYLELGRPSG